MWSFLSPFTQVSLELEAGDEQVVSSYCSEENKASPKMQATEIRQSYTRFCASSRPRVPFLAST